jgi:LPXTG-motif cell wall-anchored protein
MRGTVISKRWIAMFTAVGLGSLLVALFSPAWSGSRAEVSAQTSVCATTGGTVPTLPGLLTKVVVLPASVTMTANQSQVFQAFACAANGTEITSGVTIVWSRSPAVGSIASDGTYTAGTVSATTDVIITAQASQSGTLPVVVSGTSTAIVNPPPPPAPTPTPIPPFTGPTPVPPPKPADVQVQELVLPDKPLTASATDAGGQKVIEVSIPAGTVSKPAFVQAGVLTATQAAAKAAIDALPPTLVRTSDKIVQIDLVDEKGVKITGPLAQPITLRIPYTDAEAAAAGGALNLRILRYDTVTKGWAPLATTVDTVKKELSAILTSLSIFTLGTTVTEAPTPVPTATPAPTATAVPPTAAPQPTATPKPALPSTGGLAPSSPLLFGLLAGGIALAVFGVVFLRRRQQDRI